MSQKLLLLPGARVRVGGQAEGVHPALRSGELLHVGSGLEVSRKVILDRPPRRLIALSELDEHAAAAQAPTSIETTTIGE